QKRSYDLELIKAKGIDTTTKKGVLVLFYVTTKKASDFPPSLSMRMTYRLGDDKKEKIIDINKSNNVKVLIYSNDVNVKSPAVYELIKDKVDIKQKKEFLILAFYIDGISDKPIDKMSLIYGLWEKKNANARVETKYEFTVDH